MVYRCCWQVEVDIRNIKTTFGMETLSCKTPEMCKKEMWAYLLAYKLLRLVMAESAMMSNVLPRALSFKHALQLWLSWSGTSTLVDDITKPLALIAEKSVGNRPGRTEPRAVKKRLKPYPSLTKPGQEAREQVRKYGHPKSLSKCHSGMSPISYANTNSII